jgi:chaperone BCS1
MKMLVDNATPYQVKKMFLRFYEGQEELADEFLRRVQGVTLSTAQLQGHFVFYKQDAQAAVQHAVDLVMQSQVAVKEEVTLTDAEKRPQRLSA